MLDNKYDQDTSSIENLASDGLWFVDASKNIAQDELYLPTKKLGVKIVENISEDIQATLKKNLEIINTIKSRREKVVQTRNNNLKKRDHIIEALEKDLVNELLPLIEIMNTSQNRATLVRTSSKLQSIVAKIISSELITHNEDVSLYPLKRILEKYRPSDERISVLHDELRIGFSLRSILMGMVSHALALSYFAQLPDQKKVLVKDFSKREVSYYDSMKETDIMVFDVTKLEQTKNKQLPIYLIDIKTGHEEVDIRYRELKDIPKDRNNKPFIYRIIRSAESGVKKWWYELDPSVEYKIYRITISTGAHLKHFLNGSKKEAYKRFLQLFGDCFDNLFRNPEVLHKSE